MENPGLSPLVAARAEALAYYSPYYFLRQLAAERQQELFGTGAAAGWEQGVGATIFHSQPPAAALISMATAALTMPKVALLPFPATR